MSKKGFTFIELLIALAVIAISFLPLMRMFSTGLEQAYTAGYVTTARYLAQEGMEKVKNIGFTKSQFKRAGNTWDPPLNKPPLNLNGQRWRVLRKIVKNSDPLEVRVSAYIIAGAEGVKESDKPVVELVTLVEDLDWAVIE